ncbi:MAG: hypothetical protein COA84_13930 [Robiginitomaculum sp.]|nr:MAG: hypothetical protein COA84_13930 [Robiginitomaculum sp.]
MHINTPPIINDLPTIAELVGVHGSKNKAAVALKIARRVYIRTRAAEAQNWKCCYCGVDCVVDGKNKNNSVTLEHVKCVMNGGKDNLEDCVMACASCNNRRGSAPAMSFDPFVDVESVRRNRKAHIRLRRDRKAHVKAEKHYFNNWTNKVGEPIPFKSWINTMKISANAKLQITYMYQNIR